MQSYRLMRKRLAEKDRQALELKHRLSQSQLDTLKWQLQPHFLFNTLNAIAGLIHEDPDKADTMVCQLSVLLRGVLEEHEAQQVSLKRELELLRAYLAIEQVRFDDRFQVVENIDPACLELLVPVLLLQPLVENAIRHGLAPRSGKGTLHLSASRNGKQLSLSIEDDGIGPESRDSTPTAKGFGIGLANAQARLEALFGPRGFQLQMGSRAKGGTRVTIDLPASPVALPPPHS
jgi:LytS/YehU family sensor histidine kinase